MRTIFHSMNRGALVAALLTGLGGCSKNPNDALASANRTNIQRLSNMYAAFQHYNGGRGPEDATKLREFITGFNKSSLAAMNVDLNKLDGLFLSERDGKPFNIRYNADGGHGAVIAVVLEQEGKGGRRQVGYTSGKVEEVDDATYAKLWAGESLSSSDMAPSGDAAPGKQTARPKQTGPTSVPPGAPTGPPGK